MFRVPCLARSVALACILAGAPAIAQTNAPTPGPTHPAPPNPMTQPGATIRINPTKEQCEQGWNPTTRWTKQQFQEFCTRLRTSK